ncbi:AAA family ATPase [Pararhizobium sp. LjRoot255]|uniref:AAA family ATPase n=1 Tax=Pararhizobium sp. LjRoot255 TaxID=3342298 RepID=UPI003ECCF1F9
MSYRSASRPKSPPHLAVAVARCGVRNALRPFLRRDNLAFIAVLIAPEDTADYYRRAVSSLIQDPPHVDEYGNDTAAVFTVAESTIDPRSVYDRIKHARQVVVVTERREYLPADFLAGADLVMDVVRPTPEHFIAAARESKVPGMTRKHAEFLSTMSFDAILVAVRPARPLMSSVRQMKRMAAQTVDPEPAAEKLPSLGLENMHGYGKAKDWGLQLAVDLRAWRDGDIAWDDVDRGALLFGPPGCGKTSYAQALANSCGVKLIIASAARWQAAGHLGDYLKAMRSAFAEAAKNAPSLLFIDEFDSFGDRESGGGSDHRDYRRQVINGMLECLDPVEGREGVVVVAATNNPDAIDRALLRSGRLETQIEIPLPDAAARVEILRHHLRDNAIRGDLAQFVSATNGWSGADIEKLTRDARRLARRRGTPLDERILMEAMPERYVLSAAEVRRTAVHEAGHAIIGTVLGSETLVSVAISREAPVAGVVGRVGTTTFVPQKGGIRNAAYYDDWIAMLLAGTAAELVVLGDRGDGAGGAPSSDLMLASDAATRVERQLGLGANLSADLGKGDRPLEHLRASDPDLRRLVDARLRTQFDRAVDLLGGYRPQLDHLVELLLSNGIVMDAQVRDLFGEPIPNAASVRT